MSVEAMAWAFQVPLKPCPKSVLVALANRADEDGYCWPGIGDLQLRTGWGVRSIQTALHELEASGMLRISPRFLASGTQTSNLYQLVMTTISRGEGAGGAPKSSSEQSVEQSSEQSPKAPTGGACGVVACAQESEFEQFWEAYPAKTGKKAAWRAWQKARDKPGIEELLTAVNEAMQSDRWQRGFIPNPATWLNQGRWADRVNPAVRPARTMVEFMAMHGGVG